MLQYKDIENEWNNCVHVYIWAPYMYIVYM